MRETTNSKLQTSKERPHSVVGSLIFDVWNFFLSRARSIRHAFHGWLYVLRHERNAWVHAVVSIAVFAVGLWVELDRRDWAIILLTMVAVWMGEFINTSLEAVVDLASPEHHPLAKVGKDVGAAAVLIAALTAVVIGLLILGPPLWAKISGQ